MCVHVDFLAAITYSGYFNPRSLSAPRSEPCATCLAFFLRTLLSPLSLRSISIAINTLLEQSSQQATADDLTQSHVWKIRRSRRS